MAKLYTGTRTPASVMVAATVMRVGTSTRPLRHVPIHAATGCIWGYGGFGPADVARAILVEHPAHQGRRAGETFSRWTVDAGAFCHHQYGTRDVVITFGSEWGSTTPRLSSGGTTGREQREPPRPTAAPNLRPDERTPTSTRRRHPCIDATDERIATGEQRRCFARLRVHTRTLVLSPDTRQRFHHWYAGRDASAEPPIMDEAG